MQVILLDKIKNLGNIGDCVRVKPGYARNFLLPRGLAQRSTPENIASVELRRAELEKLAAERMGVIEARAHSLETLGSIEIAARVDGQGKLFGSVDDTAIAAALTDAGIATSKRDVKLPDGSLRSLGEHSVTVHLHADRNVVIRVQVQPLASG